jgi:hypothetical protein
MLSTKNFYWMHEKLLSVTVQAHMVETNFPSGFNQFTNLLMGNYSGINIPVIFKQQYGKRLDDILGTGTAILYLISDRMVEILDKKKLTGWKIFDIKLLDKKDNEIKGYNGFSITGRCGPIDYTRSRIIKKKLVQDGPLSEYYKGLYVGLDVWDGSDFFLPKEHYGTIVTSNTADVLKKSKLTNVRLSNLAEIEMLKL